MEQELTAYHIIQQRVPTMYFIDVTTSQSSIMRLFPHWAEIVGLHQAQLVGVDLPLHAPPEQYRRAIAQIKIASARSGADTLLIERYGFLGGTSTMVLDTFYGFYPPGDDARRVVGGIPWEIVGRLANRGMMLERPSSYTGTTGTLAVSGSLAIRSESLRAR